MDTIFQTKNFNKNKKYIQIENHDIYYEIKNSTMYVNSRLVNIHSYSVNLIEYLFSIEKINRIIFKPCSLLINNKLDIKKSKKNIKNNFKKKIFFKIKNNFDINNNQLSNFKLILPTTIDEYNNSLGKKTRQHLRWYQKNIDNSDFSKKLSFIIQEKDDISYLDFKKLVELNHERCSIKGFKSGTNSLELYNELKDNCLCCYFFIDKKIIAGTISSIYNNELSLFLIAHDNTFNSYNIGNLILLKTIEVAITKQIKIFNMLWGKCTYKERFKANEELLFDFICYKQKKYFYKDLTISLKISFNNSIKFFYLSLKYNFVVFIKFILKKLGLFEKIKAMVKK